MSAGGENLVGGYINQYFISISMSDWNNQELDDITITLRDGSGNLIKIEK